MYYSQKLVCCFIIAICFFLSENGMSISNGNTDHVTVNGIYEHEDDEEEGKTLYFFLKFCQI